MGYGLAFAVYPLPAADFDYSTTGITADWPNNLQGFAAHWNKNTNLAWAFDRWFLNLFPREKIFQFNEGGYATLSFILTQGTMLLGQMAGNVLHADKTANKKIQYFFIAGVSLLALGFLLHITGINPIVKRIWTPAWTIFIGGICFLMLTFLPGNRCKRLQALVIFPGGDWCQFYCCLLYSRWRHSVVYQKKFVHPPW